jgi:hypothetical protein
MDDDAQRGQNPKLKGSLVCFSKLTRRVFEAIAGLKDFFAGYHDLVLPSANR